MTLFPAYQIKLYQYNHLNKSETLKYTFTSSVQSIHFKNALTDAIGYFTVVLPTVKGKPGNYLYTDIAPGWKIKIWLGYKEKLTTDPNFAGIIDQVVGPLSTNEGFTKQLSGFSLSEILQMRLKKNKYYNEVPASTIVTEWANALGLGTEQIDVDSTPVTLEVETKNYFDLLREISDYWVDGSTQIAKDFCVDVNNNLVWKSRPFRPPGTVETLTVGKNILDPMVVKSRENVKDSIAVKGFAEKPVPTDKDEWTDSLTNWSTTAGTTRLSVDKKIGSYSIENYAESPYVHAFTLNLPNRLTIRDINTLYFWSGVSTGCNLYRVHLYCPNDSNYFYQNINHEAAWTFNSLALGPNSVYNAQTNPNGIWTVTGSPNWWDIKAISFYATHYEQVGSVFVDGLYFYPDRWYGYDSFYSSQMIYGVRELEVIDDKLHSDVECAKRAKTLLNQKEYLTLQVDLTIKGNPNVLVGDRLPLSIPAENVNASFDVLEVAQSFYAPTSYITLLSSVNSAIIRKPIERTPLHALSNMRRAVRLLNLNEKGIT